MTVIEIPYEPRAPQLEVHQLTWEHRYGVAVCHRRFGKSVMAVNELVRRALSTDKSDWRGSYIGPTYTQTKAIVWDYLKHFTDSIPGRVFNESELRVDLPNGSRIRLFGGDKPDALRGLYHDCVFMDEFDDSKTNLWTQVVYPATVDRKGCAYFIGTFLYTNGPLGQIFDHAQADTDWFSVVYRASETKVIPKSELRIAQHNMSDEEYEREFECNRSTAVKGAYYAKQIARCEKEGRITAVKHDRRYPVLTGWDIGFDTTSIWFAQPVGNQLRFIKYFEDVGDDIVPYATKVLSYSEELDWRYKWHYFPHDMEARDFTGGGKTRLEVAQSLGLRPATVVERRMAQKGMETHEGINAVRRAFDRFLFDAEECKRGLDCLRSYRPEENRTTGEMKALPLHDWASHGATAIEQIVRGYVGNVAAKGRQHQQPTVGWIT